MKRLLLLIAAALAACAVACVAVYHFNVRTPPQEWVGKKLGLQGAALEDFARAHSQYASTCAEMCVRIQASDKELAALISSSRKVTPEIEAAIARSDAIRNECRRNMLAHFYKVAAMLEPDQAKEYLGMVLPLIVEPELMSQEHPHP